MHGPSRWPLLLLHAVVLRPLLRLGFGLTIRGGESLRGLEQFILAANHNSHLDVLLLYAALPWRQLTTTHPVAAADYFGRRPWLRRVLENLFAPVWVDREAHGGEALAEMQRRLDEGDSLIIFPEGTRGEPGRLAPFRRGIGRLVASRRNVPVVPAFILGPERSLPRGASLPLPLWHHVAVGPPLRLTVEGATETTAAVATAVVELGRVATAHRHRRAPPRPPGLTVAVVGIDGSGKSTLARDLAGALSHDGTVCLISDGLELFAGGAPAPFQPLIEERLRRWLGRRAKQARSLAGYKLPKLAEMLLRERVLAESRRWYQPAWTVLDGAPLLNITAWSSLYREQEPAGRFCAAVLRALSGRPPLPADRPLLAELAELRPLRRLGLTRLRMPDAVVFLDVEPRLALDRIAQRGAPVQAHESDQKLTRLRAAYNLACATAQAEWGAPLLRLPGTGSPEAQAAAAKTFAEGVRRQRHGR